LSKKNQQSLYNWLWSWHTYAGLLLAPLLLCSALTGAIYSFNKEISDWLYRDLRFTRAAPGIVGPGIDEQMKKAQEALGSNRISAIIVNQEEQRNHRFVAEIKDSPDDDHGHHLLVYTDSRSGDIAGTMYEDDDLMEIVLALHRDLLSGTPGRIVVELCASWGLFLLLSGLYVWWPRGRQSFRQVLRIHSRTRPRTFFRSLHAVLGVYSLFFFALFIITGLVFTPIWGEGYYKTASKKLFPEMGKAFRPAKVDRTGYENQDPLLHINQIVAMLRAQARPGEEISLMLPENDKSAIKVYTRVNDDQFTYHSYDVDPYTARIIASTTFDTVPLPVQVQRLAVTLHRGKIFGVGTQILALLACLSIALMIVAGIALWWVRRPESWQRVLMGPGRIPKGVPKSYLVLLVLGMILFPVFGLSVLAIVALQLAVKLALPQKSLGS
jgi:uncharacterized iron-regulated membrane protein